MKKQFKKLSLNKKTISNLNAAEMSRQIGGVSMGCTYSCHGCGPTSHCGGGTGKTKNGNTCDGHNTCQYTCV